MTKRMTKKIIMIKKDNVRITMTKYDMKMIITERLTMFHQ